MELRTLGKTEIKISPILMGTLASGKVHVDRYSTTMKPAAPFGPPSMRGITAFDTAEVYGNGHSERILGEALTGVRHKAVIATKVFSNHLKNNQIKIAFHRSLKNLKTDYIDLYQIHWPPGSFGQCPSPHGRNHGRTQ